MTSKKKSNHFLTRPNIHTRKGKWIQYDLVQLIGGVGSHNSIYRIK